jgi:hypothetical protein
VVCFMLEPAGCCRARLFFTSLSTRRRRPLLLCAIVGGGTWRGAGSSGKTGRFEQWIRENDERHDSTVQQAATQQRFHGDDYEGTTLSFLDRRVGTAELGSQRRMINAVEAAVPQTPQDQNRASQGIRRVTAFQEAHEFNAQYHQGKTERQRRP